MNYPNNLIILLKYLMVCSRTLSQYLSKIYITKVMEDPHNGQGYSSR